MPFRATSRQLRRTIFSILLFALALAQTLGVVHRIVHSPLTLHATAAIGERDSFSTSTAERRGTHWLQALFSGHDTDQGCHLFDQLSHSDLLQVEVAVLACVLPDESPDSSHPGWHLAAQAAGFLARGPPSTS